ncbi:MAG: LacI family DNA-binding transcriptional regulator [Candidatus Kaelpia aquatica]|nr:LacI family DNA-binding transcriptional regulator [Candidatus Kaelpia aquatica]
MKRITIKEVAERAGVSIATVSRALNSRTEKSVKQDTLEKIKDIIRELKYFPNRSASSLRHGFSRTIGLPMNFKTDTTSGYVGEIMKGVLRGLDEIGYDLKLISQEEFVSLQTLLDSAGVDGLIITHAYHIAYPHLEEELKNKKSFPLVVMNDYNPDLDINQVYIDTYQATCDMTEYVIKKNNSDLYLLGGEVYSQDAQRREKAFLDTLAKHNIDFGESRILNGHFNETGGYEMTKQIFIKNPDFKGLIYSLNDAMAIGALRALGELCLNCPRDVKVVGFDDIAISEHMNPPLTTIHVPLSEMGYEAIKIIYGIFTGEIIGAQKPQFDYRLIQRESC